MSDRSPHQFLQARSSHLCTRTKNHHHFNFVPLHRLQLKFCSPHFGAHQTHKQTLGSFHPYYFLNSSSIVSQNAFLQSDCWGEVQFEPFVWSSHIANFNAVWDFTRVNPQIQRHITFDLNQSPTVQDFNSIKGDWGQSEMDQLLSLY